MKLHFEEKEVNAIMEVSKFACEVAGEKMPSGMELMKAIVNSNNELCTIKPNFFNGSVDVEISPEYTVEYMNLYLKYGPALIGVFHCFTNIMEDIEKDLTGIVEKYGKPINNPSAKEHSSKERLF